MSRPRTRAMQSLALLIATALAIAPISSAFASPRRSTAVLPAAHVRASTAPEMISGTVAHTGAYWADADLSAAALQKQSDGSYTVMASSDVATDGTYSIDLPGPGKYRVGFFDANSVYPDTYYADASTVTSGTDVTVATSTPVAGINQALTPNPEFIASGTVHFAGATSGNAPVGVDVYQFDSTVSDWTLLFSRQTNADGTYRIHLPKGQIYHFGFTDFNGVFAPAFYSNATTAGAGSAVSVTTTGTPVTGIDQTMTALPSNRIGGATRYETAVNLSKSAFVDGSGGTVTIASGTSFPDSLAASTYALAEGGPLLLTTRDSMPTVVTAEIQRLAPSQIVIIGGSGAVSLGQEIALRTLGIPVVRRIEGTDRYDTAAQVAQELVNAGLVGDGGLKIAVANGTAFADAVAGAPVAAADERPVLFVKKDSIPAATQAFLSRNTVASTLVFGATGVVSDAVGGALPTVTRLGGADRYETSALIAGYGIDTLGMNKRLVNLASGVALADGLAAGPIAGGNKQVVLLTPSTSLAAPVSAFLTARKSNLARITCIGGTGSVSDPTFSAAINAISQ